MIKTKDIPQGLVDYIFEKTVESDSDVISTYSDESDEFIWIIHEKGLGDWHEKGLGNWITIVSWGEGERDYKVINLTGKAYRDMNKIVKGLD